MNLQHTKGQSFALVARALALGKGKLEQAASRAEAFRGAPEIASYFKAAIAAGNTTDADWGGPLAPYSSIRDEFLELVRVRTVIGRLTEARRLPLNTRASIETEPATAYWTTQGSPKPISRMSLSAIEALAPRKATCIVVLTNELIELSRSVGAIQKALVSVVAAHLDASFLDVSFGTSTSAPTSITNGATVVSPTGTTGALIAADLKSMVVAVGAATAFDSPVFVVSALAAAKLAAARDSAGGAAFPNINAVTGGFLIGIPVLISNATKSADSPSDDSIVLLNQSDVVIGDDNEVTLSVAEHASLQMDSAPSAGAQNMVSLWQSNLTALKVERYVNWILARTNAAATLVVTF